VFPTEFGCLDQGHVVLVALVKVVLVHFFTAVDTFAGIMSACMERFITTQHIMETMACKTRKKNYIKCQSIDAEKTRRQECYATCLVCVVGKLPNHQTLLIWISVVVCSAVGLWPVNRMFSSKSCQFDYRDIGFDSRSAHTLCNSMD
jgi:hypothetical protein